MKAEINLIVFELLIFQVKLSPFNPNSKILNHHNFNFTINPGHTVCEKSRIFLLVAVNTRPENHRHREIIRESWTRRSLFSDLRIVFLLGSTNNALTQRRILLEANLYRDIVQQDFMDTYRNLTLKGVMSLKWISQYCANVDFLLKSDDDVLINIFQIIKYLKENEIKPKSILCNLMSNMKVIRDQTSKWFISKQEYQYEIFCDYCSGVGYMITGDLIKPMLNISYHIHFMWIDDVYMSGILGTALKANYYSLSQKYWFGPIDQIENNFEKTNLFFVYLSQEFLKFSNDFAKSLKKILKIFYSPFRISKSTRYTSDRNI
ncbi:beta-1-3-galactosyltransferase 1-like [Brachionus plicatilis]|uniref:Hexosyltransferase n=1 Tax=Brachionus plicatilis TaxID=10195 RepID=A0A3M7PSV0_BRAPC|nr:beta-1-3-galactosyltransferase 1-like [Brachionus plicatilis]